MSGPFGLLTRRLPTLLAESVREPFTLTFRAAEVEHAYRQDRALKLIGQTRLALVMGILMYAMFGALDRYLIPEAADLAWWIRFAIVCPVATAVVGLTFVRRLQRWQELATVVSGLIGGVGIVAMVASAKPPGSYLYYAGLLLVVTFNLVLLRPRIGVAAGIAVAIFSAYEITAIWINPTPTAILINNTFFFVAFVVLALMANYLLEVYMRSDFLQRRVIQAQTLRLEEHLAEVEIRRREAEEHAQIDPLTGLYNRRHFFAMLDYTCRPGWQKGPWNLSVLLLDLDHFKRINDTFGHRIGDQVLQSIAQALRFGICQGDVASRHGGEEFAILLPNANAETAAAVAERLRLMIEATVIPTDKGAIRCTVSIGVATLTDRDGDFDALLERADRALYAAKNGGRNQVQLADPLPTVVEG